MDRFPPLVDWTPTRDTLHAYSRVLGAILRAHAEPEPDWSHTSLVLDDDGLASRPFSTRRGDVRMRLDLRRQRFELDAPGGVVSISLDGGLSATELADEVERRGEALGVKLAPDPAYYANDRPTGYHSAKAENYLHALHDIARTFESVRQGFDGEVTGMQLWPHHFDLAFEWRGKDVTYQSKDGSEKSAQAIVAFGFSTGDDSHPGAYVYANPWPFDEELAGHELPGDASWYTEAWKGSIYPYAALDGANEQPLRDYLDTVFQLASPALAR